MISLYFIKHRSFLHHRICYFLLLHIRESYSFTSKHFFFLFGLDYNLRSFYLPLWWSLLRFLDIRLALFFCALRRHCHSELSLLWLRLHRRVSLLSFMTLMLTRLESRLHWRIRHYFFLYVFKPSMTGYIILINPLHSFLHFIFIWRSWRGGLRRRRIHILPWIWLCFLLGGIWGDWNLDHILSSDCLTLLVMRVVIRAIWECLDFRMHLACKNRMLAMILLARADMNNRRLVVQKRRSHAWILLGQRFRVDEV